MVQGGIRVLGVARKVSLLFIFFVLGHNVGQLDESVVGLLPGPLQSEHLLALTVQL